METITINSFSSSPRDFGSRQGSEPQEYFVYFKAPNRRIGAKDPAKLNISCGAIRRVYRGVNLARADRVAHADDRIGRILESVLRVRPQTAREDHGVRREEDLLLGRHIIGADAVGLDALDAAAGVHVDAVGAQRRQHDFLAEHVLIRADLGQHLEDGDVAVVLRDDLGAAELQLAAELLSRTSTFRSRSSSSIIPAARSVMSSPSRASSTRSGR